MNLPVPLDKDGDQQEVKPTSTYHGNAKDLGGRFVISSSRSFGFFQTLIVRFQIVSLDRLGRNELVFLSFGLKAFFLIRHWN